MFDLGFVSAIFPDKSLEEVIIFAADNGFSCVEVMCWPRGKAERRYAGVTHLDIDQLTDQRIRGIKSMLFQTGVNISALGYYPNPLDPDPAVGSFHMDHLRKMITVAQKLSIPVVNTFIGRDPSQTIEYNLGLFAERWPETIQFASKAGIKVGIENCPMLFTSDEWPGGKNLAVSPAIWDKMFEIIPDANFGLNYDPSHLIWMQMDEVQPIYDYSERLHHIHLKDARVFKDRLNRNGILAYPLDFHSPKLPGLGDVRWRDFFSALTTVGYRGPVCIEVEDKAFEGSLEDIYTAIRTSKNYLSQFLG